MDYIRKIFFGRHGLHEEKPLTTTARVLEWLRSAEMDTGGIRVHSGHPHAYPEVTGYLIPTLLQLGEFEFAHRLVVWLISIQHSDGSFPGPDDGKGYFFDTGQVLRGLLAAVEIEPLALKSARNAAEYLYKGLSDQGWSGFGNRYDGSIPEAVHLYLLSPLKEASAIFEYPPYLEAVNNCVSHYISHRDALQIGTLTHFLAYQLEALIDLGLAELALPVLEKLRNEQRADGAVRGVGGKSWVCTPGLAQLAICWYKIGEPEPADKAMKWLESHQTKRGGFLGSYGRSASYFPDVELSWAVKFYLDAYLLRTALLQKVC